MRQWPDNICSGKISYHAANNYLGFALVDAEHGIPTIGSVCPNNPPTIRGQHVNVFNYPGQTEQIAAQLVHRWNSHDDLVKALETAAARFNLMAGVGLVNGADPKVGYRECMEALGAVKQSAPDFKATQNSAESEPSVTPACSGADAPLNLQDALARRYPPLYR